MYRYLFFDLDGTLTDPAVGITNSVMYALNKYGISVSDRTSLFPFIGPPLMYSFQNFYGFSEKQAEQAVAYYREYFSRTGIFENEVYAQIPEVLSRLKQAGHILVLATSKPEEYAKRILTHFSLMEYFDFVAGATMGAGRQEKAEVIAYALSSLSISDRSGVLMIGDRKHDILGAKANRLKSCGVLYGFGDREELTQAGADMLLESVSDLLTLL